MNNIMVDIETTGLDPFRNAIIQIGAIKFSLLKQTMGERFNECLSILPGRTWDPSTEKWHKERPKILAELLERAKDPREVMEQFKKWCGYKPVFWAKPSHFDYPFINSYFTDLGIKSPFFYRDIRDVVSFVSGVYRTDEMVWADNVANAKAHEGESDCDFQIRLLFSALAYDPQRALPL